MDLIFMVGVSIPLLSLYVRHLPWASIPRRLRMLLPLAGIGLLSFLSLFTSWISAYEEERLTISFVAVFPLICTALESIGTSISMQYQKRDFYLTLKNSDDYKHKAEFTMLDYIITFTLFIGFCALFVSLLIGWQSLWE